MLRSGRPAAAFAASLLLIVTGWSFTPRAASADEGWKLLGQRTAHGRVDRDDIAVGADEGLFRRVRFEVTGSAVEIYGITVHFANGAHFSPETRLVFRKGGESRIIDLPGDARALRSVTFRYGNLPRGGRAHVKLFAR